MPRDPKQKVHKDFNEGIYHRPPTGPSFLTIGIITAIFLLILVYFAYSKSLPFGHDYTVTATFKNAGTLRETAPVRIAGVNVGEVKSISLDGDNANVTFTVNDEGQPLHTDAQVTIRPRLFLEGNFFLDLQPGSPSAPVLDDGGNIPITHTQIAVQLDQVLTTLQQPDRQNLSQLLESYGSALYDTPTPEQDIGQDPDVQGKSASQALNESFTYGATAGKTSSQVSEAILGEHPGDLSGLINSTGVVFQKLASRESDLSALISNFSTTTGALAAESDALEQTLAELAPTLEQAQPDLVAFNKTLPPLRAFARELTPGVKELPATIKAGNPWLRQTIQLVQPAELGRASRLLAATQPNLTSGTNYLNGFLPQLNTTSRCVSKVLVPAGDTVVNDQFSTNSANYLDFFYGAASQNGVGANFDGNGQMLRTQFGGGPQLVQSPVSGVVNIPGFNPNTPIWGYSIEPPIGTQPQRPSSDPPIRTDVRCPTNDLPNINGSSLSQVGAPTPAAATSP